MAVNPFTRFGRALRVAVACRFGCSDCPLAISDLPPVCRFGHTGSPLYQVRKENAGIARPNLGFSARTSPPAPSSRRITYPAAAHAGDGYCPLSWPSNAAIRGASSSMTACVCRPVMDTLAWPKKSRVSARLMPAATPSGVEASGAVRSQAPTAGGADTGSIMNDLVDQHALPQGHHDRLARAQLSLEGLSVGDALGQEFMMRTDWEDVLRRRITPDGCWRWPYTDDTVMAVSIVEVLGRYGHIDQEALAQAFARRFADEPNRGYGPGTIRLLRQIASGGDWRSLSRGMFGGQGSFGNGSAMRVGPVGAYFADDLDVCVNQAQASALVTHAHPEAQAGAIAVSVAAAAAWRSRSTPGPDAGARMFEMVIDDTPESQVRAGLARAAGFGPDITAGEAAAVLGNGSEVSCQDTVPFCLWAVAKHLGSFEDAMWTTLSALGDCDTTCAIVGSIVALATGLDRIPRAWREKREALQALQA